MKVPRRCSIKDRLTLRMFLPWQAIKDQSIKRFCILIFILKEENIMIGVNASVNRIIAIAKPSACSANEILGWLIHWWSTLMFSPALNWFNNRTAHLKMID
jgi:hypothetical protein